MTHWEKVAEWVQATSRPHPSHNEMDWLVTIEAELRFVIAQNIVIYERLAKLATPEQVQAVADGVKAIQDAETIEETQLTQIVTDLEAAAGNNPDPLLQTSIEALTHIRDSVAAFPGTLRMRLDAWVPERWGRCSLGAERATHYGIRDPAVGEYVAGGECNPPAK